MAGAHENLPCFAICSPYDDSTPRALQHLHPNDRSRNVNATYDLVCTPRGAYDLPIMRCVTTTSLTNRTSRNMHIRNP